MNYILLVNKDNLLDKDFIPEDLVTINEPTGFKVDKNYVNMLNNEAYLAFKRMQAAALTMGFHLFVDSSYRSYAYQETIFNHVVQEKGLEHAKKYVALPGSSEHQTGLAIDVIYEREGIMLEEQDENDPELLWLRDNAYKYGFILRYPKGKEDITGYNFEPWHFRFVGEDAAGEIYQMGLTLEEYIRYKALNNGEISLQRSKK